MRENNKSILLLVCILTFMFLAVYNSSMSLAAKVDKKTKAAKTDVAKVEVANAAFDGEEMSDMSDFDPNNPVTPTGDTIKIAIVMPFSGPAALNGEMTFLYAQWVAHDINKRGGIWVDGKKKLIQVIKADHMSKPDQAKKICERMILQEKVHVLFGTAGSNLMKVMMEVGNQHKTIVHNFAALSDDLMDATQFSRYTFMTTYETSSLGRGIAYYFGQIRKKEKKFYILCQDYSYGHGMAEGFKQGLKDYYPEAQIVGEDYHKCWWRLKGAKSGGAVPLFFGDWIKVSLAADYSKSGFPMFLNTVKRSSML